MKIDVITRHAVANYGSILQAYATQQTILKLGYDCEIINYIPIEEKGNNIASTLCKNSYFWNKNKITRLIYKLIQTPNYKLSYEIFCKYRKKILKETKEYNYLKELYCDMPIADVYCTGSDQVWGEMAINKNEKKAYFLEFVPNNKKCISYASSMGKIKFDKKELSNIKEYLKKYSTLLVRENSAKCILNDLGFDNVEQVLDPTLLLNKNEWESFFKNSKPLFLKIKLKKYLFLKRLFSIHADSMNH